MRFTYKDTKYRIVFGYEKQTRVGVDLKMGRQAQDRRVTVARIKTGEQEETVVSEGRAMLHPTDQFRYETGRKIALRNALDKYIYGVDFRRAAWTAYHTRPGGVLSQVAGGGGGGSAAA